jgi:hypothetical protein
MRTLWVRFLNWMVPPMMEAAPSRLDRWDGVGHTHKWQGKEMVWVCSCGVRVPRVEE